MTAAIIAEGIAAIAVLVLAAVKAPKWVGGE